MLTLPAWSAESPRCKSLELDHLANEANSAVVEPLCANHHAIKSYMAESGPMAALRLRDPERSALLLQAAFEFGLGAMLACSRSGMECTSETARCIFLGVARGCSSPGRSGTSRLTTYFENMLGPGYDRAIVAAVPR